MSNFSEILRYLYPKADYQNCEVFDGNPPHISKWDTDILGTKPSYEEVMAKKQEYLDFIEKEKNDLKVEIETLKTFMASNGITKRALREFLK